MPAPNAVSWIVRWGESLDVSADFPCLLAADPRIDGSRFKVDFKDPVAQGVVAQLVFDSGYSNGNLQIADYQPLAAVPFVRLAFRASIQEILQAPVGVYAGDLIYRHPRDGAFGDLSSALAAISLTVQWGTTQ